MNEDQENTNQISIRPDLKDIENTILHLYELELSFYNYYLKEWSELWHRYELDADIYQIDDSEFAEIVEKVYSKGIGTALSLAEELTGINHINKYPKIKDYINTLKGHQSWIDKDEKLLKDCKEIINKKSNYKISYYAIRAMVRLHEEQLNIIRGFDSIINTIENSERFRAEEQMASVNSESDPKKVFVVHGRNKKLRDAMFDFLRALKLDPIEWSEASDMTGKTSPYIGEILDVAFSNAMAIVVLMTPDDLARLKESYLNKDDESFERVLTPQARPNVLFEAGFAMGRDETRTILVECGKLRPFSDKTGRYVIKMDGSQAKRNELANKLEMAGCKISKKGNDWLSAGDFTIKEKEETEDIYETSKNNTPELKEETLSVLLEVMKAESAGITLGQLVSNLESSENIIKHHADLLIKVEYIHESVSFTDPTKYYLDGDGRTFLAKKELLE